MTRLYVSMLNIKKAKLSRQTPTSVLKGHASAWPFYMVHASGAACIEQADKKTPHQFWQGVGFFVLRPVYSLLPINISKNVNMFKKSRYRFSAPKMADLANHS